MPKKTRRERRLISQSPPVTTNVCQEKQYFVAGLHCASCELLIESKLLEKDNIKSVEVSQKDQSLLIEYSGEAPSVDHLNSLFHHDGYAFSDSEQKKTTKNKSLFKVETDGEIIWNFPRLLEVVLPPLVVLTIVVAFLKLSGSGLTAMSVNAESTLLAFVGFGLVAGLSTCSALVGGIILSMSKQWATLYNPKDALLLRLQPQLLFNFGRFLAYTVVGLLLGALGNFFQISLEFSALLTIAVSVMMVILSLQMLGFEWANKFQPRLPKVITRNLADQRNFSGKLMPSLMGAATVFLPCGFTITAQGLALLSGDPIRGALIMSAFVLGTTPILFLIGLSSLMFTQRPHITRFFSQVAGLLIIFFSIFNLNSAFNVLGLPNISSYLADNAASQPLAKTIKQGSKQIIKMSAKGVEYSPSYFQVKVNQPVEWQITDDGVSGCASALIAKDFFDEQVRIVPGKTVSKEFTPTKVGKFRFSCWMGMATGTIEVVN